MKQEKKYRILFSFIIFLLLFSAVLGKAFYLQVIKNNDLISYSENQYLGRMKVYPNRGIIYDRNGEPLAINGTTYNIFVMPKLFKNYNLAVIRLAQSLPSITASQIRKKIEGRNKFTWIKRKAMLNEKQLQEIKSIEGVFIEEERSRYYPNHELASQSIGFVGIDNAGLSGIEYYFDKELKGEPVIKKYLKDAKGRPLKFESNSVVKNGTDLYLTIDKSVQALTEKYLKETVQEFDADMGGVGIMDVETGEILAMANYPTFDPAEANNYKAQNRKLSFVSDPFEPGSMFKTLTVAAAMKYNVADEKSSYFCEHGKYKLGDHTIGEAEEKKSYGWLTVSEILKYSSNIGTTKIAFDVGFPRLKEMWEEFHIGQKTGIEVPGESKGIFSAEKIIPIKLSNMSFGQGLATTGIQLLASYAAIANGGFYVQPTLLANYNDDVFLKKNIREPKKKIISTTAANQLTKMLVKAVEEGTGANAKIPYFSIAGKTGTAQRPSASGGYDGYVSGFIGFPVNAQNRFVMLVYIDHPKKSGYYGNVVAAPLFNKIAQYLLYRDKNYETLAVDQTKKNQMDQISTQQSSVLEFDKSKIPNFIGLDKKSAIDKAEGFNLKIRHTGFGVVRSQSIQQGTSLIPGIVVELKYEPPQYEQH